MADDLCLPQVRAIGDMTPVMPQISFRERSIRLRQVEDDKNALIDVCSPTEC